MKPRSIQYIIQAQFTVPILDKIEVYKGKGLEPLLLLVIDLLGCSQEEYVSKFVIADFSYCVLIISTGITRHLYRLGSLILLE